jgi:DNA processing protein
MKTNIELSTELSELLFSEKNFMTTLKVMSWHMENNKSGTDEQKIKSAFNFVIKPEFDRLSEHGLSDDTKNIITGMTYTKNENTIKEMLLVKEAKTLEELFEMSEQILDEYEEAYEILDDEEWDEYKEPIDIMAEDFDSEGKEYLTLLAIQYNGNWNAINDAIANRERITLNRDRVLMDLYNSDIRVVTICEDEYPELLKKSYQPPFVLFYVGDLKLINQAHRSIGLLGKELITNRLLRDGNLVTLIGKEQIEIKSSDSYLFVSSTFGAEMGDMETAKLFASLSNEVYLDNAQENTITLLTLMFANKFEMDITSTLNSWIIDVAGEDVMFVRSFVDLL